MDKNTFDGLKGLALFSQLGLSLVVPILLGTLAGHSIGEKTGKEGLCLAAGIIGGTLIGVYSAYRLIRVNVFRDEEK